MLFTTITYAFFLPLIFVIYWAVPEKYRYIVLFGANIFFYMYGGPVYILLLAFIALITYLAALWIEKKRDGGDARKILIPAVVIVTGFLAVFKYTGFAIDTIYDISRILSLGFSPSSLKLALPLGISFYSFAAIGYVVDVYRGKIPAEKNFLKYFDFVAFFPSVMSGPINRAEDILPRINEPAKFDYDEAVIGLRQMLWGFFKKLIVADTLARYVDFVFDNARAYFGLTLITATVFYTFQIYCDFSGYSDIAIGTARLLGISCRDNFKSPYYSRSDREFWNRWHISLSSWFRDYVYIPLGGSRVSEVRRYINIMLTMLLSGLWHGADWSFVIWGGLHGVYQIVEDFCHKHLAKKEIRGKKEKDIVRSIPWNIGHGILTFGMVSFAWSFFRANNTSDALYIAAHMPRGLGHPAGSYIMMLNNMMLDGYKLAWIGLLIAILMVVDYIALKRDIYVLFGKLPIVLRWIFYICFTVFIIVMTLNGGQHQEFIYFQF
ncbi:MAG: MBOAT family protein [Lachnospiraceae bacterium]|nr:MBOAT family protein [Lachnospiraceae bacterium]